MKIVLTQQEVLQAAATQLAQQSQQRGRITVKWETNEETQEVVFEITPVEEEQV